MQRTWRRAIERGKKESSVGKVTKKILSAIVSVIIILPSAGNIYAAPTGAEVTTGAGTIIQNGATTTITQTTAKLGIDWQSFSIAAGEKVQFVQPSLSSVALNRVVGNNASAIYGSLIANGRVYLINPNGILFAPGAQVNVGGLVASTRNITDENFRNGNNIFTGNGTGSVINQGTITADDHVVFIGSQVKNEGVIAARVAALTAGNKVSLDFSGDKLLNVTVDTGVLGGSAVNSGTINAEGGLVVMSAGTKDALLGTVVNNSGAIKATGMTNENGVIRLEAGSVTNSGTLDASGKGAGQTGGTVKVLGDTVTIAAGSQIDVSGDAGGGTALVGGNFQGKGPEHNATNTKVETGTSINAAAINNGNGGKVVVWANNRTEFRGDISAKGGANGGDGGNVEVSGKRAMVFKGKVDATAPKGKAGNLLLDPYNVEIVAASSQGVDFDTSDPANANVTPNGLTSRLSVADLLTLLNTANVTISTGTAGSPGVEDGNIIISTLIDSSVVMRTCTLTLSAANDIYSNAVIWGPAYLNLVMNAGNNIAINSDIIVNSLTLNPGLGNININTSTITTTGHQTYNGAVLLGWDTNLATTDTGNITFGSTVDSDAGQYRSLRVYSKGSATFDGMVGGLSTLASLDVTSLGATNINSTYMNTDGDQTYRSAVVLGSDTRMTTNDGNILFNSTINGNYFLRLTNMGTTLGGAVSVGQLRLDTLGTNFLNGGTITTTGDQSYSGAVVLGADTSLTTTGTGNITFGMTVDSDAGQNRSLVVDSAGSTTFGGTVGGTNALASLAVNSTGTHINTSSITTTSFITTTGNQTYNSAVVLGTDTTLSTTGTGNVTFNGMVNSDVVQTRKLVVNSAGDTTFGDEVGGTNALSGLTVNSAGTTNINASSITTTGNQTYRDAVVLGTDTNLAISSGGIQFHRTVNGNYGLTVNSIGNALFGGAVGGTNALASLAVNSGGITFIDASSITTTGHQTYNGAVLLCSDTNLATTDTETGNITFGRTVDSFVDQPRNLVVNSTGSAIFGGAVGGTNALASLAVSSAGATNINTSSITTIGNQTYNSAVVLGTDTLLKTIGTGNILFESTVNGNHGLALNSKGSATFGGTVGETNALTSLAVNSTGATNINTSSITTIGTQTYRGGDVALGGAGSAVTLTTTNSNVTFESRVSGGGKDLTVSSGTGAVSLGAVSNVGALLLAGTGAVTFADTVNNTGSISVSGATNINTSSITTTGNQIYSGPVALGTNASLTTTTGTGHVLFNGTVNSDAVQARSLVVNSAGSATFNGTVGGTRALASLDVTSVGRTYINASSVSTIGNQTYSGPVVLGADTSLTTTGNITFGGTVDSDSFFTPRSLVVNSAGNATFGGPVGGMMTLASLDVTSVGKTYINSVSTIGNQTYSGPVVLGADTSLTTAGNVLFNGTVNSDAVQARSLVVNSEGNVTFNGKVGGERRLASLDVTSTGTTSINTTSSIVDPSITTTGDQTYNGAVVLGANTNLMSWGNIVFARTVNGNKVLTVYSGSTTFGGAVGGTNALASLEVGSASGTSINGGNITTTGSQTYSGPVTLGANTTLTSTAGGITLSTGSQLSAGNNTLLMRAGTDLTLGSPILSAAAGNAVVLTAGGRFINTYGSNAIQMTGGRWLVYSQDPANDTRGGLSYNFKQYNTAYGGTILGSGNGFIYTLAPTITAGLTGTVSKTYDGTVAATLAGNNYTTSSAVDGDTVAVTNTSGTYNDKHATTGKTVSVTGLTLAATNGGATVYGYQVGNAGGSVSDTVGTINKLAITVTGAATTKAYDGNTSSATAPVITGGTPASGEVSVSQVYADKEIGTGKTMIPSAIVNDGNSGGNYIVTLVNSASGVITRNTTQTINNSPAYQGALNTVLVNGGSGVGGSSVFGGSGGFGGGPSGLITLSGTGSGLGGSALVAGDSGSFFIVGGQGQTGPGTGGSNNQ